MDKNKNLNVPDEQKKLCTHLIVKVARFDVSARSLRTHLPLCNINNINNNNNNGDSNNDNINIGLGV